MIYELLEIINTGQFSFNESIYFLTQTANDSGKVSPKREKCFHRIRYI